MHYVVELHVPVIVSFLDVNHVHVALLNIKTINVSSWSAHLFKEAFPQGISVAQPLNVKGDIFQIFSIFPNLSVIQRGRSVHIM